MDLQDRKAWKQLVFAALVLTGIVAVFWLLWTLKGVLLPFVFAAFLAYLLNPLVTRMQKSGVSRSIGSFLGVLLVVIALLFMLVIPWPIINTQLAALQQKMPEIVKSVHQVLQNMTWVQNVFPEINRPNWLKELQDSVSSYVNFDTLGQNALKYLQQGGSLLLSTLSWAVLMPILTYFLLVGWPEQVKSSRQLLPKRWRADFWRMTQELDEVLSQYMRGQVLVMISLSVYYAVALKLVGLQVAIPVGILTGLLVIVPYLGFGLGFALAVLTAFLQFQFTWPFFAVLGIYGVGQMLESYVLTPRLVGERIGLSPTGVIMALLIFSTLFGFFGMIFALPVSAVLVVLTRFVKEAYMNSNFYLADSPELPANLPAEESLPTDITLTDSNV